MGSIVLLDEHTINKIAAGEVVDRPSSIVKELIENSIDAGATNISVEIKNGGIKLIRIIDNGAGFSSDDVELAFERHATSKIRKEEDLLKITSMGFRGEALASIAAISRVDLITKNENEDSGIRINVEAGQILSKEPSAAVKGTKIEIKDVFYNVPARFKFLKKDYTEAGYIEDVMIRTALANPNITFTYINNGKKILQTSGNGDLRTTIYDIFGKEIYNNVINLNYEHKSIKITGMLGLPPVSRSTRTQQFTYINSRYIKNKTISSAIDRACEQKFAINKHAFIVMNIEILPSHIDVNVHPAKLEVKFDDEALVFDAIYYAIKSTLEEENRKSSPFTNINTVETMEKTDQIVKDLGNSNVVKEIFGLNNKKYDFNTKIDTVQTLEEPKERENEYHVEIKTNIQEPNLAQEQQEYNTDLVKDNIDTQKLNYETYTSEQELSLNEVVEEEKNMYHYIGQVFNTYIVIQIKEKMYIIDQHAAHERLLFEQIKEAYYSKEKQSQLLLIPILIELTTKEKEIVDQNMDMFEKSGFMLEEFSDTSIKISGVPNIGYDIDFKSMFKDIVDELLGATKTQNSEKEFRFLATLACKAAVKGRMKLDEKEQRSLIDDMIKLDNPFTCPHGRPTAYEISKYEIERRFLRK